MFYTRKQMAWVGAEVFPLTSSGLHHAEVEKVPYIYKLSFHIKIWISSFLWKKKAGEGLVTRTHILAKQPLMSLSGYDHPSFPQSPSFPTVIPILPPTPASPPHPTPPLSLN